MKLIEILDVIMWLDEFIGVTNLLCVIPDCVRDVYLQRFE